MDDLAGALLCSGAPETRTVCPGRSCPPPTGSVATLAACHDQVRGLCGRAQGTAERPRAMYGCLNGCTGVGWDRRVRTVDLERRATAERPRAMYVCIGLVLSLSWNGR
eukprot:923696-Prymnesium_polylepis.1